VYHCCGGDASLSLQFADELADYARRISPPTVATRYLRHIAHVNRCHGDAREALRIAEESYEIACRGNAVGIITSSATMVASILMQLGSNDSSHDWLQRALGLHAPGSITVADVNTWSYLAELAIRQGDGDRADVYLSRCRSSAAKVNSPRSHARGLSLQTQLAVLNGDRIPESHLRSLLDVYNVVKSATWQDYTVESILLGLISAKRQLEAACLARDYTSIFRRDQAAISSPLAAIILQLENPVNPNGSRA
jgi:hypothetical protein